MATTTPNYGWTVPTSTDLVKDGATAIETLGDSIDASMFTALGTKKAGMVLLNTTAFSAQSSVSVSDVFSTTYDNYKVLIRLTAISVATSPINFRYRVSGADNSTSNYNRLSFFVGSDGSTGANNSLAQAQYALGSMVTTTSTFQLHDMLISMPFATEQTVINNLSSNRSALYFTQFEANYFGATTSFTGFTVYPGSGNITGSISVFGINK